MDIDFRVYVLSCSSVSNYNYFMELKKIVGYIPDEMFTNAFIAKQIMHYWQLLWCTYSACLGCQLYKWLQYQLMSKKYQNNTCLLNTTKIHVYICLEFRLVGYVRMSTLSTLVGPGSLHVSTTFVPKNNNRTYLNNDMYKYMYKGCKFFLEIANFLRLFVICF